MSKEFSLLAILKANTTQFEKGLDRAKSKNKSFADSIIGSNSSIGKGIGMLKGFAAAAGIAFGVGAVVDFGRKAVEAADEELKAQTKLLVALKGREAVTNNLIGLAAELQKKTLFGDETTVNAMGNLAAYVKEEEQIRKLIPLIQDLATAKGMDLGQAADLVGKSIGSSTNAMKRYGIEISGVAGSAERTESAIKSLSEKFGGQAEAAAKVGLGGFTMLKNMISDVVEDIGKWLMPAINNISQAIIKAFPSGLIDTFRSKVIDLVNWFIEFYNESLIVRGAVQAIGATFVLVWQTIKSVIKFIIEGFSGVSNIIKAVLTGNFKEIPNIISKTLTDMNKNFVEGGQKIVEGFTNGFNNTFKPKEKINFINKEKVKQEAIAVGEDTGESLGDGLDNGLKGAYETLTQKIGDLITKQKDLATQGKDISGITAQIDALNKQKETIDKLIEKQGILNTMKGLDGITTEVNKKLSPVLAVSKNVKDREKKGFEKSSTEGLMLANRNLDSMSADTENAKTWFDKLGESIVSTDNLVSMFSNSINGLTDAFIGLFEGGKGAFKGLVTSMLGGIQQIINGLLAQAIASMIAKEAHKGILGLALASVGVAGLTALWKSKVPEFASGGLVYGDTLARVGEYSNARSNPEVIAPLNKLKSLMQPNLGGEVVFTIKGNQLVGVLNNNNKINRLTR